MTVILLTCYQQLLDVDCVSDVWPSLVPCCTWRVGCTAVQMDTPPHLSDTAERNWNGYNSNVPGPSIEWYIYECNQPQLRVISM